ncbi:MAG: hypothetical protein A2Y12_15390 [Planctomycetes bacterium GWF2_42_9]|nr:MAG: hypothetical protein A2Y12_15390 [Planctomycetes bacterium GWF2_42_9]
MAAIKNLKRIIKHRNNGSCVLEAAFVLVLLLILTLATMGFGWFFFRIQQVTNATRHATRVAIRYHSQQSEVEAAAAGLLQPVGLEYEGPQFITGIDPSVGEPVTIQITGKGLDILNLDSAHLLKIPIPDEFTTSVTMAKEGP